MLQCGKTIVKLERFIDPKDNPEVEIQGDEVTKYPKLPQVEQLWR
jgi:hypothetical protein